MQTVLTIEVILGLMCVISFVSFLVGIPNVSSRGHCNVSNCKNDENNLTISKDNFFCACSDI